MLHNKSYSSERTVISYMNSRVQRLQARSPCN